MWDFLKTSLDVPQNYPIFFHDFAWLIPRKQSDDFYAALRAVIMGKHGEPPICSNIHPDAALMKEVIPGVFTNYSKEIVRTSEEGWRDMILIDRAPACLMNSSA